MMHGQKNIKLWNVRV